VTDGSGERGRRRWRATVGGLGRTDARSPRHADTPPPFDDALPAEPETEVSLPPDGATVDPLVGRTGARFGSRAQRAREARAGGPWGQPPGPSAGAPLALSPASTPSSTPSRARWSDARRSDAVRSDDDAPTEPLHLGELRNRVEGMEPRVSVRPYVRTRGRTHARSDLRIETLVSIPSPRPPIEDPEHRAIGELCDGPRSVAEVAALMRVPLGVARILIGDMADEGTLTVHRTLDPLGPGAGPDRAVMARVLRGLRAL
jgi:hypothetical protein